MYVSVLWSPGSTYIFAYRAMSIATHYTFIAWSVKGLSDGVKRTALFSALKPYKSAIVCLQETFVQSDTIPLLGSRVYQTQFHSTHTIYSRGVSILISNDVSFHLLHTRIDEQGRYSFLLYKLAEMLCIVVNVYVQPPFSPDSLKCLAKFIGCILIYPYGSWGILITCSNSRQIYSVCRSIYWPWWPYSLR